MVFVAVVRGEGLAKKDRVGKGDPYFVVRYAGNEEKTKSGDGSDPSYDNQHFNMDGNAERLYIMQKDSDMGADSVVAFCTIDMNKLGDVTNGWFNLYTDNDEQKGRVLLNIGKNGRPQDVGPERSYESYADEEVKTLARKVNKSAKLKDGLMGAGAVLGGMGAAFLGKKTYDHFNPKEEEKVQEQQQELQQQGEQHQQNQQQGSSAGSGGNWDGNFVSYQAGQEVVYDGQKYRVLQSHNSQSDWVPTAAHSLFQRV